MTAPSTPRILIIAGSDSGGGAGIQADIKTVTMLGGHAMTAITAITAQNTVGVQAVHAVPTDMVVAQMRSVLDDIGVDAVKIGMIGSADTARAVADVLEGLIHTRRRPGPVPGSRSPRAAVSQKEDQAPEHVRGDERGRAGDIPIVFDPVMVATSGAILADADTIAAFRRLMALATIVTPNLPELDALGGEAAVLAQTRALLVKGGHGTGAMLTDRLLSRAGDQTRWDYPRIDTPHAHGTGCTLASAIAVGLAEDMALADAVARAIRFVRASLEYAPGLGHGHGPMGQQCATGFRCPA
jgi:hydroxymethylpyrimidine/phosphomethylpyrimidine kinase